MINQPNPLAGLDAQDKALLRAGLHPYMQAALLHQLNPVIGTFKFRIGEEVQHLETQGVYIITGLPHEHVMKEGDGWAPAYQYLMVDGRSAHRSQKQMEDGRFVSMPEGSALEYAKAWEALMERETNTQAASRLIDFDTFVHYGLENTTNIVNDMPWSFIYKGYVVTHENDDLYLLSSGDGSHQVRFQRGQMLYDDQDAGKLIAVKSTV